MLLQVVLHQCTVVDMLWYSYSLREIVPASLATTCKIKASFRRRGTRRRNLPGCWVEIVGLTLVDNTSPTGLFTLKPGAAGTFSIKITKAGFQQKTVTGIIVQIGKPTDVGTIALTA